MNINVNPHEGGSAVTGSINGAPAAELYLALLNLSGSPFLDERLPSLLSIIDSPDLKRVDLIFSPEHGAVIGEITKLSVVPLPTTGWLFISGPGALGAWLNRK